MEFLRFFLVEQAEIETRNRKVLEGKQTLISEIKSQLKTAADVGDEEVEARLLNKLGNIYAYYSDCELAETMCHQGLAIARQMPDKHLEAVALVNLGLSCKRRLNYKQALSYYRKASKISRELNNMELEEEVDVHIIELSNMRDVDELSKE